MLLGVDFADKEVSQNIIHLPYFSSIGAKLKLNIARNTKNLLNNYAIRTTLSSLRKITATEFFSRYLIWKVADLKAMKNSSLT